MPEAVLPAITYRRGKHAATRTDDYVFSQLIPYIGNKRKLLPLIHQGILSTGVRKGAFIDLFAGSTVVSRYAKRLGFRVVANDWEPYSYFIARATVKLNRPPPFECLGGPERAFAQLNALLPFHGYIATNFCPANDEQPDPESERMFFTRANGERIDAIREQIFDWQKDGMLSEDELAYLLAPLLYSVSYVSNTSGVFKGFHYGWGGKTGTALYRILSTLSVRPPVILDNHQENVASKLDAHILAPRLREVVGDRPAITYLDPPYNQHPYGSNYHVLNTVALWDKPPLHPTIRVGGKKVDKSAIRKDWRTERRSAYNSSKDAIPAFRELLSNVDSRWTLLSYSTEGNMPIEKLLNLCGEFGHLRVFANEYKRYRVSPTRPSPRPTTVEFVAVIDSGGRSTSEDVQNAINIVRGKEEQKPSRSDVSQQTITGWA